MATPRRQSARLPKPVEIHVEEEEEEDDDESMDEFESDLSSISDSEEEGSDWEGENSRTTTGKAPAKRAKVASSSGSKKTPQKITRGKRSLGLLLDMPLDILFEILSRLSPKDLVNMTRTNKSLRETLMSRNAITVWKAAREVLGIPACPSDFSEPKWAVLMSGSTCQICGAKSVYKVDFYLRRRVCTRCKKGNLLVASKFASSYPTLDSIILNFTPYTNVGGWAHGHASGSRFFWRGDITSVAQEWAVLQKDLQAGSVGAKDRLNQFKLARIDLVDEITKHAVICENWADSAASQRATEADSRRDKRYNAIVEKFQALGYDNGDIQAISGQRECNQNTELTDKIWRRIQPILEPIIQERRESRLALERRELIKTRMGFLKTAYRSYLKTLPPSRWVYQPKVEDVAKFPTFDAILASDNATVISVDSFQEVVSTLPDLISAWSQERRTDLRSKLPPSVDTKQIASSSASATADLVDLATSVFVCVSKCWSNQSMWGGLFGNALFGWDGAIAHRCKVDPYRQTAIYEEFAFSEKASAAAAKFVSLAGLDVASATAADMDKKGLRFFCSICGSDSSFAVSLGRRVYDWRSGVAHLMTRPHPTEPTWTILTADEVANVTKPEETDPIREQPCWTCNHCPVYLDLWEKRQKVIEHLETTHNITNAKEPDDLFYLPYLRRVPMSFPVFKLSGSDRSLQDQTIDIKCNHCNKANNSRLFKLSGVFSHLKDKHQIQNPVKGRDWVVESPVKK